MDSPLTVEVRFKGTRKAYFHSPVPLHVGDAVVVDAERGRDYGHVTAVGEVAEKKCGGSCTGCAVGQAIAGDQATTIRNIIRQASPEDQRTHREVRASEEDVRRKVMERVRAHELVMKVSDCEWQWDRAKLTIYFTAEKRVDFRALVRDLASLFRTRIELRQIGVRDEAARLGGVGRCGREYCCSSWLKELTPVNLGLAKDQHLSLNPSQISGGCGRLLCCLKYEHEFYVSSRKRFPREGKVLQTAHGAEKVVAVDIFRERVYLRSEANESRIIPLVQLKQEMSEAEHGGVAVSATPEDGARARHQPEANAAPAAAAESDDAPERRRRRRRRRDRRQDEP
ncbi:MAG TPA: regulatory iron-sulfur-containing complex subunit RicT [Gemmatimonadales bacterium]|jgi:cell fate regulator YaaT (PSP1 superfamily)|nr:regulatory iron-sulfur-containing complex subunit RicT [Gemmatimonadales bacterium]